MAAGAEHEGDSRQYVLDMEELGLNIQELHEELQLALRRLKRSKETTSREGHKRNLVAILGNMRRECTRMVNELDNNSDAEETDDIVAAFFQAEKDQYERKVTTEETDDIVAGSFQAEIDQYEPFRFHAHKHGTGVQVSNDDMTAERRPNFKKKGVVVSSCSMKKDMLYEVEIIATNQPCRIIQLGVSTKDPELFDKTPDDYWKNSSETICVRFNKCKTVSVRVRIIHGNKDEERPDLVDVFKSLKEKSRVGLMVDSYDELHLFVDGQDKGVIASTVKDPCYFVFDLRSYCTKVTTCAVRPVEPDKDKITEDADQ